MKIIRYAGPLLALLLAACGSKINQSNFDKIKDGMSEVDVKAILGSPTSSDSIGIGGLSGTSDVWQDKHGTISIQFVNGKVKLKSFNTK